MRLLPNNNKGVGSIHLLDEATINKIAAGEVIERPASVVKELVENSIDSKASIIKVDIGSDTAGIFRIRVIDDGCGMNKDSALLSIQRHATSKITNAADLDSIQTMGFRGEALASIAGVSKFTLITKEREGFDSQSVISDSVKPGTRLIVEGGEVIDLSDIGAPVGTSILVENLFFNTPARKKFMKSRQTEFSHVYSVIENAALANPNISFALIHNGKTKLSTLKTESLIETVSYIYGREMTKDLCPVSSKGLFMKLEGLCSLQSTSYPISKQIIVSINHRPVYSPAVIRAVKSGYGTLLPRDRYPAAFLNITIDKGIVDVNVHPAKREVRLSREKEISEEISSAIRDALERGNIHLDKVEDEKRRSDGPKRPTENSGNPFEKYILSGQGSGYASSFGSMNRENAEPKSASGKQKSLFGDDVLDEVIESDHKSEIYADKYDLSAFGSESVLGDSGATTNSGSGSTLGYHPSFTMTDSQLRLTENFEYKDDDLKLPPMEVVGQYDAAYIIARMKNNDGDELVIIDQHAAHERILYDQVLKIRNSKKNSQELLVPAVVTLKPKEAQVLLANLDAVEEDGFVIEEFGTNTFAVRSVPMILGKRIGTEILNDIIADLMEDSAKTFDARREKITSTIACRAAIKAGAILTIEQMTRLLYQLSRTDLPYTCPHGRPTMIVYSRSKLDSLFLRS